MSEVTTDISDFEFTNRLGLNALSWKFYGNVLVTTKVSKFWRQEEVTSVRRNIYKQYGYAWCYVDDGEYLPSKIDALVRAWEAQHEATIEEVKQI